MSIHVNIFIEDMVLDLLLLHFFSVPSFGWGKNFVIFGVDNSSSVDFDNEKKRYLSPR